MALECYFKRHLWAIAILPLGASNLLLGLG